MGFVSERKHVWKKAGGYCAEKKGGILQETYEQENMEQRLICFAITENSDYKTTLKTTKNEATF